MVTDNVGDVGRHQNLLAEIPVMVLLTEDTGHRIGPNINGRAAADYPKIRRRPQEPKSCDVHQTFNGAQGFLGGLRRSFAASPW